MSGELAGRTSTLTFAMQIGLVRESVTVELEGGELTMATLKDIACAFVDRKVGVPTIVLPPPHSHRWLTSTSIVLVWNVVVLLSLRFIDDGCGSL